MLYRFGTFRLLISVHYPSVATSAQYLGLNRW